MNSGSVTSSISFDVQHVFWTGTGNQLSYGYESDLIRYVIKGGGRQKCHAWVILVC